MPLKGLNSSLTETNDISAGRRHQFYASKGFNCLNNEKGKIAYTQALTFGLFDVEFFTNLCTSQANSTGMLTTMGKQMFAIITPNQLAESE